MLLAQFVLRVCALFDTARADPVPLPTARARLTSQSVDHFVARTRADTTSAPTQSAPIAPDESDAALRRMMIADRNTWAMQVGDRLRQRVDVASRLIDDAERRFVKPTLRPLRNAYLAHNLRTTWTPESRPRFIVGQERQAIRRARRAVHLLHLAVNGNDFDWRSAVERRHHQARDLPDPVLKESECIPHRIDATGIKRRAHDFSPS